MILLQIDQERLQHKKYMLIGRLLFQNVYNIKLSMRYFDLGTEDFVSGRLENNRI